MGGSGPIAVVESHLDGLELLCDEVRCSPELSNGQTIQDLAEGVQLAVVPRAHARKLRPQDLVNIIRRNWWALLGKPIAAPAVSSQLIGHPLEDASRHSWVPVCPHSQFRDGRVVPVSHGLAKNSGTRPGS